MSYDWDVEAFIAGVTIAEIHKCMSLTEALKDCHVPVEQKGRVNRIHVFKKKQVENFWSASIYMGNIQQNITHLISSPCLPLPHH